MAKRRTTLQRGDLGMEVEDLQKLLVGLGIAVDVTGEFDGKTEAGVIAAQRMLGFKPTGRTSEPLLAALGKAGFGKPLSDQTPIGLILSRQIEGLSGR